MPSPCGAFNRARMRPNSASCPPARSVPATTWWPRRAAPGHALVHAIEPEARPDQPPFLRAGETDAQAARAISEARRKRTRQRERDRHARRVVDRAFAERVAVEMRAHHDPVGLAAGQVE